MTDEQIDGLLLALDAFARGVNEVEYGLPVLVNNGDELRMLAMRQIVRKALAREDLSSESQAPQGL